MTDDIVKYLRLSQTRFNRHDEAADEIERLRAEVAYLKQGWYPTPAVVLPYRWWKKAVRGEVRSDG